MTAQTISPPQIGPSGTTSLPETTLEKIRLDLQQWAHYEKASVRPAFVLRMVFLTPGFQFVFARRLQELAVRIPVVGRLLRRIIWWASCLAFGSELAIGAEIGGGLYVPHPFGIVVGCSRLGRRIHLLQNVTLGRRTPDDPRDPEIADDVTIAAGAVVLGAITVGAGATIGANSVVLTDVPPRATAIGAPARILVRRGPDSASAPA